MAEAENLWWLPTDSNYGDILQALNSDFKLLTENNPRPSNFNTFDSMYTNRRVGLQAPLVADFRTDWFIGKGSYTRVPYNLMKQVVDEVVSRITKTRPKAKFITVGGDPKKQHQADLMQRWTDHQLYQQSQVDAFEEVIGDACRYGLGALKVIPSPHELRVDAKRVYPGNLYVDLQETVFDKPTRLHHRRFVAKATLKMLFPKFEDEIETSGAIAQNDETSFMNTENFLGGQEVVELVESWHLPSYEGAKDGRRVLWVQNTILQERKYTRRSFPFSFFNWKRDPQNKFYGIGLCEDLMGVHIDANVTLNRVNTAIEKVAVPKIVYQQGSVQDAHLRALPGLKIGYAPGANPPQTILDPSVPQDLLNYVQVHKARAYEIAGMASAQALGERIPSGLETGRAVQNYFNVESVPFSTQLQKYERFIEDVANANIAAGRELYQRDKKYAVLVPGDNDSVEKVQWKDVALDPKEDSYVTRAIPISALSETFSARLEQVQQIIAMVPSLQGQEERIVEMLGLADVEWVRDAITSSRKNGHAMIDLALREGTFTPPTPFMNLGQFIIDADEAINRAERMGYPEQNIATLRRMRASANEKRNRQTIARDMQAMGANTPAAVPTEANGQVFTEGQAI